jgi:hypothetical protein
MANVFDVAASALDLDVESLLRQYAFDYAIERENLLENPLLNVHKAREMLDKILEEIKSIEDSWNSEEL